VTELWRQYTCALAGWRHTCSLGYHRHHLVNLSKLRSNAQAKGFVERRAFEVFLPTVCGAANISRLADTKEAQAILLRERMVLLGEDYVRGVWKKFSALWTGSAPDIDAILAFLPDDAPRVIQ